VPSIVAGDIHTVALMEDGTVWAWGHNYQGELGDGSTKNKYTPVQVKNLSNVKQITAGDSHTVALKEDGTVWAWGTNSYGQLNLEDAYRVETPVQVTNVSKPF